MWWKLFFLLLYFSMLLILARFFEAIVWYETGIFATQLVDPVTLSFRKLKTILECRGLGYSGLAEKRDVRELVQNSGELMQGELYSALKNEEGQVGSDSSTTFSGEMHFYGLVEDTKDGIWLVQVIAQDRNPLLSTANWGKMVQKVSQFGIRTGIFNCSSDSRYCHKRGWMKSTLIMSVPQTNASKGKVMLKEYNGRRIETEHIFKWMTAHVASRIKTIRFSEQLMDDWYQMEKQPVKMFLFARLLQPPAFFSALSIKFTGRIEFIFIDVRNWDNTTCLEEIGVQQMPSYILKTPEGIYRYGNSTGEFISLHAMDAFLRSVQPEVNDLFILSLVMVNLMAWMDLFITQGATIKRFVVLISTLGTYNSLLIISWLPILGFLQLPYLDNFYEYSLKLLRYADTTTIASWVRADDWDDDPNFLLQRLAFPDLWLRPLVPIDYIKNLPTWKFRLVQSERPNPVERDNLQKNMTNPNGGSSGDQEVHHYSSEVLHNNDRCSAATKSEESWSGGEEQDTDWSQWPCGMLHCTECVVCLENFETDCVVMGLPCGHVFHQQCIVVWLAGGRHCCPVCRWPSYKKKPTRQHATEQLEPE
uniref:Ring finger protein 103 n=1 Tax=Cyprinus carpio TaxID=7962 RepID=A0A8C2EQ32_CYPCA